MFEDGKVIVGYQGIGKSSLAFHNDNVIDLESSHFFVNGERPNNWQVIYCNIARALCRQGYTVCVSSHSVVRDELKEHPADKQIIICPSLELRDKWVKKLEYRYKQTENPKDYRAYLNANECYTENITDLINQEGFEHIILNDMGYELAKLLKGKH